MESESRKREELEDQLILRLRDDEKEVHPADVLEENAPVDLEPVDGVRPSGDGGRGSEEP